MKLTRWWNGSNWSLPIFSSLSYNATYLHGHTLLMWINSFSFTFIHSCYVWWCALSRMIPICFCGENKYEKPASQLRVLHEHNMIWTKSMGKTNIWSPFCQRAISNRSLVVKLLYARPRFTNAFLLIITDITRWLLGITTSFIKVPIHILTFRMLWTRCC